MDPESEPRGALTPDEAARAGRLLDEVVRLVDAGELAATSPERANLVGSATAVKLYSRLATPNSPDIP